MSLCGLSCLLELQPAAPGTSGPRVGRSTQRNRGVCAWRWGGVGRVGAAMSSLLRENREVDMLARSVIEDDRDDGSVFFAAPPAEQAALQFDSTDAVSEQEMAEAAARHAAQLVEKVDALKASGERFFDRVEGAARQPYPAAAAAADHAELVSQLEHIEGALRAEMLEHLPLQQPAGDGAEGGAGSAARAKAATELGVAAQNAKAAAHALSAGAGADAPPR